MNQTQRLAQSVVHRNRCGVMISAVIAPVMLDERNVEIPALHLCAPRPYAIERSFIERDRRQSRRRADTLLRAGIADIDAAAIDSDRMSAERSHRVYNQQGIASMGHLGQAS